MTTTNRRWWYGGFTVAVPQGRFFLKIDRTGIEIRPFTRRGYYLKRRIVGGTPC